MASNGFLQIGAGLGYMRPSPLLRSERKRKQINLAVNLQNHKDKLVQGLPPLPVPKRKRGNETESSAPSSPTSSPVSSPPYSPTSSPPLASPPSRKEKSTVPLVKKKEVQPLDLNLQRWQKINKYVSASQQSTLMLTQFTIVEEDVAKHLLSEDSQDTVTYLNIHLAISVGALLDGDLNSSQESWAKAREHLSGLFDTTDYEVARALFLMGGVSIFLKGEAEKGSYYLLLAQGMCEKLAMLNSDIYIRLLCFSALFNFRQGDVEGMVQDIHKLKDALALPYCPDSSLLSIKGNESFHFPKRASVGLLAQNAKNAAAYARIPYLLVEMLQSVASCLYCWRAGERTEVVASRLLKCMSNIMKELADGETVSASPGGSSNPPSANHCVGPSTYALDLRLLVTSLTADTLWQIGCRDLALQWAISFLYYSKNQSFTKLLSPSVLLSHSVLNVFLGTGNVLLLQAQLEILRPLQAIYVPLKDIITNFEAKLKGFASSEDLGLLPSEVVNEHVCHQYTTNTSPVPIIRPNNNAAVTATTTIRIPSPTTTTTTSNNNTSNGGVNIIPIETGVANIGSAVSPIAEEIAIGDEEVLSGSVPDWISNLGDIEDLPCEDLLKSFGFED